MTNECSICRGAKFVVVGVRGFDEVGRERPPKEFVAFATDDIDEAIHKANSFDGWIYEFKNGDLVLVDWFT